MASTTTVPREPEGKQCHTWNSSTCKGARNRKGTQALIALIVSIKQQPVSAVRRRIRFKVRHQSAKTGTEAIGIVRKGAAGLIFD